jgi:MFS family permease
VLLLVAIQHFDAPPAAKALIAAAFPLGLLLSLIAVHVTARLSLSVGRALAIISLLAAFGIGLAGMSANFSVFFVGIMLGVPFVSISAPLVTTVWRQSVPDEQRGRFFARITSLSMFFAVVGSAVVAWWLRDDISRYRPAFFALSFLLVLAAYASLRLPSKPISRPGRNPISALALLWRDPRFGQLNFAWFLMGIANLATMPLRTEYVAAADGLAYDPQTVLYLTVIIPSGVSLVATLIWGPLFDRFGFLKLRGAINTFFMLSLIAFFMPSLSFQILGSVLLGVGFGGGRVIWQLWVIQYAPPESTADYMSVHTFLTGVRGILGPIGAYALLAYLPMLTITYTAVAMMLASTLLFAWIGRQP